MFRKNSGIENFQAKEGEASRFCRKIFNLTGPKKLRQGTILCFRKFLVGKNILWIRGGGYHDFPSKFLSHCTEIFHWRTLWCFRKLLLSKIFMHKRGASWFCRNFLSHRTETESFVKEPFCFPEVYCYRKMLGTREGANINFPSKFFCLTVPKNFVEEPFSVSLISGIDNFYASECYATIFDFL